MRSRRVWDGFVGATELWERERPPKQRLKNKRGEFVSIRELMKMVPEKKQTFEGGELRVRTGAKVLFFGCDVGEENLTTLTDETWLVGRDGTS